MSTITTSLNNTDIINSENIHVKLQFNDEFRRFFTNPSIKFTDLESKIKSLLRIPEEKDISIKYKDEENEWITISSDVELETGLMVSGNGQLFRLLCTFKGQQPQSNPNTQLSGEEGGEIVVPHWKKYQKQNRNYPPRKDRKWKKNYEKSPGDSETNQTPAEPASNLHEDNANEENETKKWKGDRRQKKEKRGKRDRKGDRKKRYHDDDDESNGSSSDSNSDIALMSLDEIKVEISKLKEEESILKEKLRGAKESWKNAKESVKTKRKEENVPSDVILEMREDLTNKNNEKKRIQAQLRITRCRMNKLRDAAETKQV